MLVDFSQEVLDLDGTALMERELITQQNINQVVLESSEEEKNAMKLLAARGFVLAARVKKPIILRDVCAYALANVPQDQGRSPKPDQMEALKRFGLAQRIYQAQNSLELDPQDLAYIVGKVFEANWHNLILFGRVNEMLSEKK